MKKEYMGKYYFMPSCFILVYLILFYFILM